MTSLWALSAATCRGVMKLWRGEKEKVTSEPELHSGFNYRATPSAAALTLYFSH